MTDSLLDTFEICFSLTPINYLVINTNKREVMFFGMDSTTNFLLDWANMTSSELYDF